MWFFNRKMQHLPQATGPFAPGCMDVMLNYEKEGVFMRLYYPTNEQKDNPNNSSRWYPWTPEPEDSYTRGIAKVLMIFPFLIRLARWFGVAAGIIPVIYGAKPKTDKKLKCIIMSHGLGGYRSLYSNLCCELASRGYLIAAIEHRDHSACYTYYYKSKEDALSNKPTDIEYQPFALGKKKHFQQRKSQVEYRAKECCKVLDFLNGLNRGEIPENVMEHVPTLRLVEFKLSDLVGNLDMENLVMSGHSFGGATALLTLSQRRELKCGILLDPWMYPIKDHILEEKLEKERPLLFINTQTFHITSNVDAMSKYLDNDDRIMYTILHTTHESQTDTVLLIGSWLNWFMKKLEAMTALKINSSLVLEFLDKNIGCTCDVEDCKEFLEEQKANVEMGLTKPWV